MKKTFILFTILVISLSNLNAQFISDMENCNSEGGLIDIRPFGDEFPCDCLDNSGCYISCASTEAHSGNWSGMIPGDITSFSIIKLGDKIFEQWGLEFWLYIPSNKEGFFNIQGESFYCVGTTTLGEIFFNKNLEANGIGVIENSAIGDVSFNYPQDEWFPITINVDLSLGIGLGTWEFKVNCVNVLPEGTPFENGDGTVPISLGSIYLSSISENTELYLDDINYVNGFLDCELSTTDFSETKFVLYPNPSNEMIQVQSNNNIENVIIYDLFGKIVLETSNSENLNVSEFASGIYFVKVETDSGVGIQKLIKR